MSVDLNSVLINLEIPKNPALAPGNRVSIPLVKVSCTDEDAQKVVQAVEQLKSNTVPFSVQAELSKPRGSHSEGMSFILTRGTNELWVLEQRVALTIQQTLGLQKAPSTLPFQVNGFGEEDVQKPISGSYAISLVIQPSSHLRVEFSRSPKPSSPPSSFKPVPSQPLRQETFAVPTLPVLKKPRFSIRSCSASPVPVALSAAPIFHGGLRSEHPSIISKLRPISSAATSVIGQPPAPKVVSVPFVPASLARSEPPAAAHKSEAPSAATQVAAAALVQLQTQTSNAPSGREILQREIAASVSVLCHDVAMVRSRLRALEPVANSDGPKTEEENRFVLEQIAELRTRIDSLEGLASLIDRLVGRFGSASTL